MASATESLTNSETIVPTSSAGVADAVRSAHDARQPVYPLGGRTALDYGIAPAREGVGLDLTGLGKIVDYTPRDMTILVEAGVRMADLTATLAAEGQQLPIDVPRADEATIGGVVATNWNGPRRYGHGTIRDYVIGIHAVDGRGVSFKGGGRVVKNVAGYDFCKLLTGSLGTLAVITQLALKLKPLPERSVTVSATCRDLGSAEEILARLVKLPAPPAAIDLLIGADWSVRTLFSSTRSASSPSNTGPFVVVRAEGTELEAAWLADQIVRELAQSGAIAACKIEQADADALWDKQIEFADRGASGSDDDSPMVVKVAVPPSGVTQMIAELITFDSECRVQAHAGNGIIIARLSRFSQADVGRVLLGKLRPAAVRQGGSLVVLNTTLEGLTPHAVWGGRTDATVLMERIKRKFDPNNILNPSRFIF
ncbi:MAG TPA: FAD-binding oxidoreductase [Lacipirellulaceae bacterium]